MPALGTALPERPVATHTLMCAGMPWPAAWSLPCPLSRRACAALAPEGLILSPSLPQDLQPSTQLNALRGMKACPQRVWPPLLFGAWLGTGPAGWCVWGAGGRVLTLLTGGFCTVSPGGL